MLTTSVLLVGWWTVCQIFRLLWCFSFPRIWVVSAESTNRIAYSIHQTIEKACFTVIGRNFFASASYCGWWQAAWSHGKTVTSRWVDALSWEGSAGIPAAMWPWCVFIGEGRQNGERSYTVWSTAAKEFHCKNHLSVFSEMGQRFPCNHVTCFQASVHWNWFKFRP